MAEVAEKASPDVEWVLGFSIVSTLSTDMGDGGRSDSGHSTLGARKPAHGAAVQAESWTS